MEIDPKSMEKFQNNLKQLQSSGLMKDGEFAKGLITMMEKAQALVVNTAKSDHPKYSKGIVGHPSDRYYTRTGKLTNSIRPGEVIIDNNEVIGRVHAGDSSLTNYAAFIEGKYPFMENALEDNNNKILNLFMTEIDNLIKKVISRQ